MRHVKKSCQIAQNLTFWNDRQMGKNNIFNKVKGHFKYKINFYASKLSNF